MKLFQILSETKTSNIEEGCRIGSVLYCSISLFNKLSELTRRGFMITKTAGFQHRISSVTELEKKVESYGAKCRIPDDRG